MVANGSKTPVEQAFALLDAMDADGCERVRLRLGELEHARLVREVEHQKELDKLANRRRSTMSAKEKSDYLFQHGKPAYDQLPWE